MGRPRSVYQDELWRLAVARDAEGLRRARELLGDGYDSHRALAFVLALEGRADGAVDELGKGAAGGWPFQEALALDVARVRFLGGDFPRALAALGEAARDHGPVDPAVAALARECVRRDPQLTRRALRLALGRGPVRRRVRDSVSLLRARLARRGSGG